MSRFCQITGRGPSTGHNVSHSKRRTKRRFNINLQTKRIFDAETGTFVKVRASTRALRTLLKQDKKALKKAALSGEGKA